MTREFSIEIETSDESTIVTILGLKIEALTMISTLYRGKFTLQRFHMVVFGKSPDDQLFITDDNISKFVDEITFDSIVAMVERYGARENTLNKFQFVIGDTEFLYDDDSMLEIVGEIGPSTKELLSEIFVKWPQFLGG